MAGATYLPHSFSAVQNSDSQQVLPMKFADFSENITGIGRILENPNYLYGVARRYMDPMGKFMFFILAGKKRLDSEGG